MSVFGGEDAHNRRGGRRTGRRAGAIRLLIPLLLVAFCTPAGSDAESSPAASRSVEIVRPGIDVWLERGLTPLADGRIGLISNTTGRGRDGRTTLDLLLASPAIEVGAIFTPEHAWAASLEGPVEDLRHEPTGLPIFSLYGEQRRPTPRMLAGLDGLVFDIQDIGTRFYTYATTMGYAMEAAAEADLPFVVLDRPNPINGRDVSGAVLDPALEHFIAYSPVPVRHGLTIGELARLINDRRGIGADLTVIPVEGWSRADWYDSTGLLWIDPSPNIRNLTQAILYPAVGALEWTNLSVGRGTDAPFEWLGAPWIDPLRWWEALAELELPGVAFVPRRRTPDSGPWANESCGGVNLLLTDRDAFDAGLTAAALAATLARLYPEEWERDRLPVHWGQEEILEQLEQGWSARRIVESWQAELGAFLRMREGYLLYD